MFIARKPRMNQLPLTQSQSIGQSSSSDNSSPGNSNLENRDPEETERYDYESQSEVVELEQGSCLEDDEEGWEDAGVWESEYDGEDESEGCERLFYYEAGDNYEPVSQPYYEKHERVSSGTEADYDVEISSEISDSNSNYEQEHDGAAFKGGDPEARLPDFGSDPAPFNTMPLTPSPLKSFRFRSRFEPYTAEEITQMVEDEDQYSEDYNALQEYVEKGIKAAYPQECGNVLKRKREGYDEKRMREIDEEFWGEDYEKQYHISKKSRKIDTRPYSSSSSTLDINPFWGWTEVVNAENPSTPDEEPTSEQLETNDNINIPKQTMFSYKRKRRSSTNYDMMDNAKRIRFSMANEPHEFEGRLSRSTTRISF